MLQWICFWKGMRVKMNGEKLKFEKNALEQLNAKFGTSEMSLKDIDCKELKLLLYMHLVSYHFDDRVSSLKTPDEIVEIANKSVTDKPSGKKVGNYEIAKILACNFNSREV